MEEAKEERSRAFLPPFRHFATQAIYAGQEPEQWSSRAVVPPISLSTTFKQQAPEKHSAKKKGKEMEYVEHSANIFHNVEGFECSRCGNPTRDCLEKAVAALDGAKYCLAYSSGLVTVVNVAHLLKAGDTIICSDNVYVGHTDVLMGLISVNDDALHEKLRFLQYGLPSQPQFELVKRESTGCPGMISFYTKGNFESASTFLKSLKIFILADSLGGYESLVEHPAIMTHASVPKADREALGITDTFVRMSVGLEDSEYLIEDLSQALKAAIPDYKIRN